MVSGRFVRGVEMNGDITRATVEDAMYAFKRVGDMSRDELLEMIASLLRNQRAEAERHRKEVDLILGVK